jgi:glycosyltransferase involved in cell wall biosynthesis
MSELSVVIPCFNAERFLGEAIESVLAQHSPRPQLIVIDDGCTDGSVAVARGFGAHVELHSQPNAGIAAARNAGVRRALGRDLAFLDADDLWCADSLQARYDALQRVAQAEGVFGALQQFLCPRMDAAAAARIEYDARPQVGRFAGTLLIRRAAFLRAGLFDERLKVGEMLDWVSRAALAGVGITTTQTVVMRRRIHGSNTVLQQAPAARRADYLRALKSALDRRRAAEGADGADGAIREAS